MANPRTINIGGNLTDTQSYTLAPGLIQYVQSVRVTIDNSAGADATPVLSIAEQAGVVIADVPQGGVIPAGESDGAATWALRLTDDTTGTSGGFTVEQGTYTVGPTVITPNNTTGLAIAYASGVALLDTTNPLAPTYLFSGYHIVSAFVFGPNGPFKAGKTAILYVEAAQVGYPTAFSVNSSPLDTLTNNPGVSGTSQWIATAGQAMDLAMTHDATTNLTFSGGLTVTRLS